ncbi:aminoglycoside phosphotransferase family protein [Listeria booriae]|uniref:aminoglycoside phosphotransferase family protein n=1 Tax=Listeria booriae TaxID=1552123 RepID=UPI0016262625|nr:aminoglycoside phosphotransferase family protein [Listeria booriae]MBC1512030.1 phosphotransferase [Listeria booriae]MBC6150858.1 phosphotransferase [Listeria booriae]MBC6305076.1 phosphotransferase [Listeria booriae]
MVQKSIVLKCLIGEATFVLEYYYKIKPIAISFLSNGSSNTNLLIISEQGKFALKYTPYVDLIFCEYQEWMSNYLQMHFPKGIFNSTNVKGELITIFRNSMWQLRAYEEGRFYEMKNINDTLLAAEQLGFLHGLKIPENKATKSNSIVSEIKMNISQIGNLETELAPYFSKDKTKEMIRSYCDIGLVCENALPLIGESCSIIHGDYHGGNIIFNNEKMRCIIDWDTSSTSPSIFDLAKSLYMLCRKDHGQFVMDSYLANIFMDKYLSMHNVNNLLLKIIPDIIGAMFIPNDKYIRTFSDKTKLEWYLKWTYEAAKNGHRELGKISF